MLLSFDRILRTNADDGDNLRLEVAFSTITCREKGADTRTDGLLVNSIVFLVLLMTPFTLCLLATHLIIAIVILVTSNVYPSVLLLF